MTKSVQINLVYSEHGRKSDDYRMIKPTYDKKSDNKRNSRSHTFDGIDQGGVSLENVGLHKLECSRSVGQSVTQAVHQPRPLQLSFPILK